MKHSCKTKSHIEYSEKPIEHRVADVLSKMSSVAEIVEEIADIKPDGSIFIEIVGKECHVYTQEEHNSALIGGDAMDAVAMIISEIDRLSKLGIVTSYRLNENNHISLGNKTLQSKPQYFIVKNDLICDYLGLNVVGEKSLHDYISNGYLTKQECNSEDNLRMSQCTLKVAIISIVVNILISVLQCCCRICG